MLIHNTKLRYFAVAIQDASAMSLLSFDDAPLSGSVTPMALRSKLAFLSVVEAASSEANRQRRKIPVAVSRLDQTSLERIFEMTATQVYRHVQVITEGPDFSDPPPESGLGDRSLEWALRWNEDFEEYMRVHRNDMILPLPDEDEDL